MKEIFLSLFDTSKDRIKSPFIGSYITAFIIYNWRPFIFLIFSDAKIEDKIVVINHEYCNIETIVVPLFIALCYIMVLPYINIIFDKLLSYSNKIKNEREKLGEISKLHQKKEVAKLEREIAEERAGTNVVNNLKNKIDALENDLTLKSKELRDTISRYDEETRLLQSKYDTERKNKNSVSADYQNLISSTEDMKQIYFLFLDQSDVADRKIKVFLRKYLSLEEISKMKETLNKRYMYDILPFRPEVNALLIKINAFELDIDKKLYRITDYGIKFINDID